MKPSFPLFFLLASLLLTSCSRLSLTEPQRVGPPFLVQQEKEPRFWLLVQQEEQKQRRVGFGRFSLGRLMTETFFHFDLQAHDVRSTDRLWKTRLLTVKDEAGGRTAEARILGQEGELVWIFLHDQPVAVSARDGSIVADGKRLAERTPALQGVLPRELKFYTFDNGLVITAADGRNYQVRGSDLAATPYQPPTDADYERRKFLVTQWNGTYHTADFLTRAGMINGRWLGLFTEKEAAEAGNDSFGDKLKDSAQVVNEGSRARRTFWTAKIGKTREFTEGSHDRLQDVTPVPGTGEYLQAGLLLGQGTKVPLTLGAPADVLVLHRTRLDGDGRLALTRLDQALQPKWTTTLPLGDLGNRYAFPEHLLMFGAVEREEKGIRRREEFVVATELADGRTQSWNVTLERRAR